MAWLSLPNVSVSPGDSTIQVGDVLANQSIHPNWALYLDGRIAELVDSTPYDETVGYGELILAEPWPFPSVTGKTARIIPTNAPLIELLEQFADGVDSVNAVAGRLPAFLAEIANWPVVISEDGQAIEAVPPADFVQRAGLSGLIGGAGTHFRRVASTEERDAIPQQIRTQNMLVGVGPDTDLALYILLDSANNLWARLSLTENEIRALLAQEINDKILEHSVMLPAGLLMDWPGLVAPPGALVRDGSYVRISDYPELHGAIGQAYDKPTDTDETRFRLPDDRDRYVIGAGGAANVGEEVGANSVDLTHSHAVDPPPTESGPPTQPNETLGGSLILGTPTSHTHETDIPEFQSGDALGAHDNRPLSRAYLPIIIARPVEFMRGVLGGMGAESFFELLDTPATGEGHARDTLRVREDETGLEFVRENPANGLLRLPTTITESETLYTHAISVDPVIPDGVTIDVAPGSTWVIL